MASGGRNDVLMDGSELRRIYELIHTTGPVGSTTRSKVETKALMKTISEERVQNWGNTVEAQRIGDKRRTAERLEIAERELQKIDKEEEDLRTREMKKILDKATRAAMFENDRVRAMQSRVLYADVIEERKLQKKLKDHVSRIESSEKDEYDGFLRNQWEEFDMKEDEKFKTLRENRRLVAEEQRRQLREGKDRQAKEKETLCVEGEIMKKECEEAIRREREKIEERKRQQRKNNEDMKLANIELKEVKKKEEEKMGEEERKIEEFRLNKEEMMKMRKQRADERFATKMAARQRLIDTQAENLRRMKQNEDERLLRQQNEAEEREQQHAEMKRQRKQDLENAIRMSRTRQLELKAAKGRREREEEEEFNRQLRNNYERLTQEERDQVMMRKKRDSSLLEFQKKQKEEKRLLKEQEKLRTNIEGELMREASEREQDMVEEYLRSVKREMDEQGRTTDALNSQLRRLERDKTRK